MAGACTGVRRFSIARAPKHPFHHLGLELPNQAFHHLTLPPPRNSTNATRTPTEEIENSLILQLLPSVYPYLLLRVQLPRTTTPRVITASSQQHQQESRIEPEKGGKRRRDELRREKRGHIRISSPHAIPLGILSAYHDVRRGLVIPVGGHYQCRQPVPAGLLHHHVQ